MCMNNDIIVLMNCLFCKLNKAHFIRVNYFLHILGLQMYLHLVKILEDNYPEMMKRMFVINGSDTRENIIFK